MKHIGWIFLLLAFLVGCSSGNSESTPSAIQPEEPVKTAEQEEETVQKNLILTVNERSVPVTWEENESVAELKELAGKQTLTVDMSLYGGWEQVGSLGHSISRKDVQTTAKNGDIMLYSGNQIVLFYGENTWAYTKLGHIDLPEEEVTALLGSGAIRITLEIQ